LACLRIAVFEETGKLIGQRVLPLDGLQAGYRHISLRTEGNFPLSLPTLFCHIVLKTYVPDGLSDFVDALNNPKEFVTKEEKRLRQLKEKLGIDEKEITVLMPNNEKKSFKLGSSSNSSASGFASNNGGSSNSGGGLNGDAGTSSSIRNKFLNNNNSNDASAQNIQTATTVSSSSSSAIIGGILSSLNSATGSNSNRKDDSQQVLEKITRDTLKSMKGFQKLLKKQSKENENLKKKHNKERALMQKQHSAAVDKMAANYDKTLVGSSSNNGAGAINNNTTTLNFNTAILNQNNENYNTNDMNEKNYKSKVCEIFIYFEKFVLNS
jgi:phosphatidylinositol phospholipase C beta